MTDRAGLVEKVARAAYIAHHRCGPTEEAFEEPNMGRGGFKTEVVVWNAVSRASIATTLDEIERHLSAVQYDPAPYTALKHMLAILRREALG